MSAARPGIAMGRPHPEILRRRSGSTMYRKPPKTQTPEERKKMLEAIAAGAEVTMAVTKPIQA